MCAPTSRACRPRNPRLRLRELTFGAGAEEVKARMLQIRCQKRYESSDIYSLGFVEHTKKRGAVVVDRVICI